MRFVLAASIVFLSFSVQSAWERPDTQPSTVRGMASILGTAVDPIGDNFDPGPDLTRFSAISDGTNLNLELTFAGPINPPDQPDGTEAIGAIELDLDQSDITGSPGDSAVFEFCPSVPDSFSPDVFVSLFDYDPVTETAPVIDFETLTALGDIPVIYLADSVAVSVPLELISDDGIVDAMTVIGNFADPTDCAPDGAVLTSVFLPSAQPVPTLSNAALVILLLLMVMIAVAATRRSLR